MHARPDPLPHGPCHAVGLYFFNFATGESVWELPEPGTRRQSDFEAAAQRSRRAPLGQQRLQVPPIAHRHSDTATYPAPCAPP